MSNIQVLLQGGFLYFVDVYEFLSSELTVAQHVKRLREQCEARVAAAARMMLQREPPILIIPE